MTAIEQAIRDAVEKGGFILDRMTLVNALADPSRIFLDPAFWQALGKARGWEEKMKECGCCHKLSEYCRCANFEMYEMWRKSWHRFIDHLAEGKDAESFFANLE